MTIKQTIDEAFPQVAPGFTPLGARVLVQLKTTKKTSSGGIVLVEETKSTEQFNTQIAKIIKLGPLAFRNRETGNPWTEGLWVKEGDFVRCARWGGDRVSIPIEGQEESALFCVFNDHELIAKIDDADTALTMSTYIL